MSEVDTNRLDRLYQFVNTFAKIDHPCVDVAIKEIAQILKLDRTEKVNG